jgi:hypothetical protein
MAETDASVVSSRRGAVLSPDVFVKLEALTTPQKERFGAALECVFQCMTGCVATEGVITSWLVESMDALKRIESAVDSSLKWNVDPDVSVTNRHWHPGMLALPSGRQWTESHWNAAYLDKVNCGRTGTVDEHRLLVYLLDGFSNVAGAGGVAPYCLYRDRVNLTLLSDENSDAICLIFNLMTLHLIARCVEEEPTLQNAFFLCFRQVVRQLITSLELGGGSAAS